MQDDLISRQDAIDALGDEPEVWTGKDEYAMGLNNQWHYDRNAILRCPSAQPQSTMGQVNDTAQSTNDCISRQAAIDGFYEMASDIDHLCTVGDYISFLESLSTQPEVVRCEHCVDWQTDCDYDDRRYCATMDNFMLPTDFCSYGDRRQDGNK